MRTVLPGGFAIMRHETPIPDESRFWAHGFGWFLYRDGKWGFLGGDPHQSSIEPPTDEPASWDTWEVSPDAALWNTLWATI